MVTFTCMGIPIIIKKKEGGGVMSGRFNELDMAINFYKVLTFEALKTPKARHDQETKTYVEVGYHNIILEYNNNMHHNKRPKVAK